MDRSTTGDTRVEFRVLGPIEIRIDGLPVDIGGFRQRRLLALLLSRSGGVVETDALAEYVWDDADRPDNAVEAARTYISRLRRSMSEAGLDAASMIVTQAPGYRLAIDDAEVDSDRFEKLVIRARSQLDGGDAVSALVGLDDAIGLWRGTPYQEFKDQPWIESEVARLAEMHTVAIEQRAAARLDLGAHAEVVGDLEQLVADQQLRSRPVELLMLALYRSGRQAEALRVGFSYRRAVGDVGLDPPESFAELEARIVASDDDLRPVTASTDTIRGYRLADKIGEGSFSVVYRSVQPSLGREVAVKQIRAKLADRPDFIRRFETEAQTVAALEHPHIVPLYDYWREPGSAYLVMRWLRGGTLEARLRRQRLDADESVTLASQIGSALATAHHAGVDHRDVRPANVFVDEIGNNYLGDFGIATDARDLNGGRDDTRGLGNVLFEAVTGKRPGGNGDRPALSTLRPDLPDAVEGVLLRAMVGAGDEAYATVEDFVDDYVTAVNGTTPRRPGTTVIPLAEDVVNPYKGLRAFQESDADDFRGRDRLIDRLLHQLAEPGTAGRLVAAVGPSGSGKSSLVRAGLVPRVRRGAIGGSETWFVTTMLPGPRPFDEFEAALNRIATTPTTGLAESMAATPHGIARAVGSTLPDEIGELLLVIDQFEELFTLADDDTRTSFLTGLVTAVTDPRARLRVVITIRADHWHRPLQHPDLAHLLETSAVTVTPMAADELERAIVDPARAVGVTFEAGLVADIVAEVHEQPGALPLMQYLLTELFDARDAGLMELDTYRRVGGVAGGLARRADDLYDESNETEQDGIRRLFSRLITPGEGTEDTRRRVALSELSTIPDRVVERYADARLLTFDHDLASREPTVEVAHEALIREWHRLRAWIDEDRESLRTLHRLTMAAAEWDSGGRPDADLYRGARLESAELLAATHPHDLTAVERAYVAASLHQRDANADAERRRVRRLRAVLAATAVIASIALAAGAVAWTQQRRADDNTRRAESERQVAEDLAVRESEARAEAEAESAAADDARDQALDSARLERQARDDAVIQQKILQSAIQRDDQPTISLLLAREVFDRNPGPDTLGALLNSLARTDGYLGWMPSTISWNQDQWLGLIDDETVVVRTPKSIDVYDLATRTLTFSHPSDGELPWDPATGSADAGLFATVESEGDVVLYDHSMSKPVVFAAAGQQPATSVAVGATGAFIVGYESGDVVVFDSKDDTDPVRLDGHSVAITRLALSRDGKLAATNDELGNLTVWDVPSATPRWTITYGDRDRWRPGITPVGFEPFLFGVVDGGPPTDQDDIRLEGMVLGSYLTFGRDGATVYWINAGIRALDAESGAPLWTGGTTSAERQIQPLPSGELLIGHRVYVDGGDSRQLDGIAPGARTVMTSDTSTLVALNNEGIHVWSANGDQMIARGFPRRNGEFATLSDGGTELVAFGLDEFQDGTDVTVWDVETKQERPAQFPDGSWVLYNTTGDLVWRQPRDGIQLVDPATYEPVSGFVDADRYGSIVSSPDGAWIALGREDVGSVTVHDAATGSIRTTLTHPLTRGGDVWWTDVSPDGRLLAAADFDAVGIWDTSDWSVVAGLEPAEGESFTGVEFSPDSRLLAVRSNDGIVFLHDIASGETETLVSGTVGGAGLLGVNGLEFTDDGNYLVATAGDGISLIDVGAKQLVGGAIEGRGLVNGSPIAGGGQYAATATDDYFLVWNLDPSTWADIACRAAGRNMTLDEWEQFGWPDEPYHATCEEWPNPS